MFTSSCSITTKVNTTISPWIYGINFPTSASYIQHLGVTLSRWGGNAVTAYNPFGGFTNAGNDWYFENRVIDNGQADDWIGWVEGAGSSTIVTIPAYVYDCRSDRPHSHAQICHPLVLIGFQRTPRRTHTPSRSILVSYHSPSLRSFSSLLPRLVSPIRLRSLQLRCWVGRVR